MRWSRKAVDTTPRPSGQSQAAHGEFDSKSAGLNPQAWLRNQTVRDVLEVFHGDIVEIQP